MTIYELSKQCLANSVSQGKRCGEICNRCGNGKYCEALIGKVSSLSSEEALKLANMDVQDLLTPSQTK